MNTFTRMSQVKLYDEIYLIKEVYENGQVLLETIFNKVPSIKLMTELRKEHAQGRLSFMTEDEKSQIKLSQDKSQAELMRLTQFNSPEIVEIIGQRKAFVDAMRGVPLSKKPMVIDLIKNVANNLKIKTPSFQTVARMVKSYRELGVSGLMPSHYQKGRKNKNISPELQEIFDMQEEEHFQFKCRQSYEDVYNAVIGKVRKLNLERLKAGYEKIEEPTRYQVRKFMDGLDKYLVTKNKKNVHYANNKFRSVYGITYEDNYLDCVQIDHTMLDVILTDDKGRIIGRPKLTICVDVKTRLIVGYDLSFDEPSAQAINNCLLHVVAYKEKQETEEIKINGEWLTFGVPKNILTDNGQEFHSFDYEKTQAALGTNIKMAPAGKPWPKGINERIFRQINEGLIHKLPATTLSNVMEKQGLNPEKFASITLVELKALLEKWILEVYHKRPHRGLEGKSPEMVYAENRLDPKFINVPADMELLKNQLGHWESRVLTHKGIEYENLKYNNNSVEFQNYRKQYGDRLEVEIIVDKKNLGSINLITKDGRIFKLEEYSKKGYADGISWWYHKKISEYTKKHNKSLNDNAWIEGLHELDALILSVQQASLKAKPKKQAGMKGAVKAGVIAANGTLTTTTTYSSISKDAEDVEDMIEIETITDIPTEYTY